MKARLMSFPMMTVITLVIFLVPEPLAKADSLSATLEKDRVFLYEMITVRVTLELEDPFLPSIEDPYEASRQLWRLRRRLSIELRAPDGETLTEAFLFGIAFVPTDHPAQEFRTTGWGFLGEPDRKGENFEHWNRPGNYVLVICDKENKLESKSIPIILGMLDHGQLEAAQIFASGGVDAISLVGQGKHWRQETLELFSRLSRDYPETIHGKYAIASLALLGWMDTFAQHNNRGGAEVWGPVAAELKRAAAAFEGAHPVRGRVLFDLARAQVLAGKSSDARRTAETLSTDFPTGELGHKARKLLSELDKMDPRGSQESNRVQKNNRE